MANPYYRRVHAGGAAVKQLMTSSEGIFIADDRLRPIWRFFLSLILVFAVLVMTSAVLGTTFRTAHVHPSLWVVAFWQSLVGLAGILGGFKVMTATFEGRPLGSMGLAFHPRWWKELIHGLMAGAAMLFLAVIVEWASGLAHFTLNSSSVWRPGLFTFVVFALAAANEEATFRGYSFQRLAESITSAGAVAVMSTMFGLAHFLNPHRTWVSTLNTALVGIPFCIAYLRTRSLWMPIGMHFIWNFLLGFFLGLPVSGIMLPASILVSKVKGPAWLTGGDYGPEGGLLATAAILIVAVYLLLGKSIYTTEEMKALVFAPVKSKWPAPPTSIVASLSEEQANRD